MTTHRKPNAGPSSLYDSRKQAFPAFVPSLLVLLCAALLSFLLPTAQAAPAGASEATLRAAVAQAVAIAHPEAANPSTLKILYRGDLNDDLSKISPKGTDVSFYEAPAAAANPNGDHSVWAVVSHNAPLEPYGLYDFESSQRLDQAAQEFNRMVSQLGISVTNTNASDLARFFLECCAVGDPGDVVVSEDTLHHSVERDYMQVFGEDVYRALWSFTQWWQGFAATAYEFPPVVEPENGGFHIAVERVVLNFGMHPQLQQCNLEVSRDGNVQVGTVEAIFPRQERWLSYDPRTNNVPQFHSIGDELQKLKALVKH